MKRNLFRIFIVLVCMAGVGCSGSNLIAPTESFTPMVSIAIRTYVYGTSTKTDNGTPLNEVTVRVQDARKTFSVITDSQGMATITITSGTVSVRAEKVGYIPSVIASAEVRASGETWSFWLEAIP